LYYVLVLVISDKKYNNLYGRIALALLVGEKESVHILGFSFGNLALFFL
jgi:hypothetical protein